ncbi:MAG: DUF1570 domain-containing protein [Planctomycetota bacterium]|jgi:hypothetical protein
MRLLCHRLGILATLAGLLVGGCVQPLTSRVTLPAAYAVVRDQLVVHSDFALPAKHRLLEELNARRTDLRDRLDVPLSDEPIDVYLFRDADRFAGFIRLHYPDFPPRRAYFLKTDTRLQVYAQWCDQVAEDLRHEVTHGYLHSVVPNVPLWLDEGLAEYFESPRGSRGMNRRHLSQLAQRLAEGPWQPDLKRLERLARPFDITQDQYAESWAWVHFLLEGAPRHRTLLPEYLGDLRRNGSAEPLSSRLARRFADPNRALVAHVARLTATAAPAGGASSVP